MNLFCLSELEYNIQIGHYAYETTDLQYVHVDLATVSVPYKH